MQRSKGTGGALVWRTILSGAPGPYNSELSTFEFLRSRSAIIHRTAKATDSVNSEEQCAQKSEQSPEAHRTVNCACPVRHQTVWCH
jgi:hypothetical protein